MNFIVIVIRSITEVLDEWIASEVIKKWKVYGGKQDSLEWKNWLSVPFDLVTELMQDNDSLNFKLL